jgi:hypothetical protein
MKPSRRRVSIAFGLLCLCILTSSADQQGQSDSARSESSPGAATPGVPVRAIVIPTGFQKGEYSALVQIAVDGSPLAGATWNLEASFVLRGNNRKGFSGRVEAGEPGTPAVLEAEMTFEPGPYELALSAEETTAGQTGSGRFHGSWPDPDKRLATVSEVAVLQPIQAAFVRDGISRAMGALGRREEDSIQTELAVALVCLVCRGTAQKSELRIERRLRGKTSLDFNPIRLGPEEGRCAQVRDLIPPGTMTAGWIRYEVRVLTGDTELVTVAREFSTIEPAGRRE